MIRRAAECPREMGHLQPGAGRPLFQRREKVNYTPQAVGPGGREAAMGCAGHNTAAGGSGKMRRVKRGKWEEVMAIWMAAGGERRREEGRARRWHRKSERWSAE